MDKTEGPGSPLSKESFLDASKRLEDLDKKDKERRRTAELKNDLEAYIYSTKEKVSRLNETSFCLHVITGFDFPFFPHSRFQFLCS